MQISGVYIQISGMQRITFHTIFLKFTNKSFYHSMGCTSYVLRKYKLQKSTLIT